MPEEQVHGVAEGHDQHQPHGHEEGAGEGDPHEEREADGGAAGGGDGELPGHAGGRGGLQGLPPRRVRQRDPGPEQEEAGQAHGGDQHEGVEGVDQGAVRSGGGGGWGGSGRWPTAVGSSWK